MKKILFISFFVILVYRIYAQPVPFVFHFTLADQGQKILFCNTMSINGKIYFTDSSNTYWLRIITTSDVPQTDSTWYKLFSIDSAHRYNSWQMMDDFTMLIIRHIKSISDTMKIAFTNCGGSASCDIRYVKGDYEVDLYAELKKKAPSGIVLDDSDIKYDAIDITITDWNKYLKK